MGWTTTHRAKGTTTADFFLDGFNKGTIFHATGLVDGTFYAAVETPSSPGEVWGLIALTFWSPKSDFNFGYKDMSEEMGVGVYAAPTKVLDALTPTDHPLANAWREDCRAYQEQRKAMRGLCDGDVIVFGGEIKFTDGAVSDRFIIRRPVNGGSQVRMEIPGQYGYYRMGSSWRNGVVAVIRDGVEQETPYAQARDRRQYVANISDAWWRLEPKEVTRQVLLEHYGVGADEPKTGWWLEEAARREYQRGERFDVAAAVVTRADSAGLSA